MTLLLLLLLLLLLSFYEDLVKFEFETTPLLSTTTARYGREKNTSRYLMYVETPDKTE